MKFQFKNPEQFSHDPQTLMVSMDVFKVADGFCEHYRDGRLRATVALENWQGYCVAVPAAARANLIEIESALNTQNGGEEVDTKLSDDPSIGFNSLAF